MKIYRTLKSWKKSHKFVISMYKNITTFRVMQQHRLSSQIVHVSAPIPRNIAESHKRESIDDFARFIQISLRLSSEVGYKMVLVKDLKYLTTAYCSHYTKEKDKTRNVLRSDCSRIYTN